MPYSNKTMTFKPKDLSWTVCHCLKHILNNLVFFSATSTTLNMGYDPHLDGPGVITSSGGTPTPTSASGSGSGASRTSSSWTKQGVQVLPTAVSPRNGAAGKQRAFKASNRDSPDEGIQDDCSTDVWTSRRWRRRLKWCVEVWTVLWWKKLLSRISCVVLNLSNSETFRCWNAPTYRSLLESPAWFFHTWMVVKNKKTERQKDNRSS